jgi:hypothetical protein
MPASMREDLRAKIVRAARVPENDNNKEVYNKLLALK